MKKLFATAVLALSILTSSFAADVNTIDSKATYSFSQEFADATNVKWTSADTYVKATFTLNKKSMEAFYDLRGELIATSNTIEIDELPTSAKRAFAKKYANFSVKEAIQVDTVDETAYYLSAENETQSVVLKVSAGGLVSVYKSVKK